MRVPDLPKPLPSLRSGDDSTSLSESIHDDMETLVLRGYTISEGGCCLFCKLRCGAALTKRSSKSLLTERLAEKLAKTWW